MAVELEWKVSFSQFLVPLNSCYYTDYLYVGMIGLMSYSNKITNAFISNK